MSSNQLSGVPWGKIYKAEVLQNFQFPEGYWFEDIPITFILTALSYRHKTITDVIYGYRLNPNGITAREGYYKKSVDTYWVTEKCLEEFPLFDLPYDQRAYEFLLQQSIMNARRTFKQPRMIQEDVGERSYGRLRCEKRNAAMREKRMPIKFEIDRYLERFRWGVPEPHVSDTTRQCVQEFLDCWDEEVRENSLLNTPESTCRGFRILLEKFPELKESYFGLKIQDYLATNDSVVLGEILDGGMKLRMLKESKK